MEDLKSTNARSRRTNGWMISTIILAILSIIMTIVTIVLSVNLARSKETITYEAMVENGKSMEDILAEDLEVSIDGDFTYSTDEDGEIISGLAVSVKNKSNSRQSFTIRFEATNDDGSERLANDYLAVEDLAAGQSQDFTVFNSIDELSEAEQLASAKFSVVNVVEY